jgi:hypothetical protein
VQLKVGAATEVVNVGSESPTLNLVDASLGNSVAENQVKEIPLEGRNVPAEPAPKNWTVYNVSSPEPDLSRKLAIR